MIRMDHTEVIKYGSLDMDAVPKAPAESVPMPVNCREPCCYGRGTNFCFPCYRELLKNGR